MRDLRIQFNGETGTRLLLDETVEGKLLLQQKYLINTATTVGSDRIYPTRGTKLLSGAIGGAIIDNSSAVHLGNFAALDTIHFCTYEEHPDVYNKPGYVMQYGLTPMEYNRDANILSFKAKFTFNDNTATEDVVSVSQFD